MSKITNRTGRSDKAPRHVRLYHWMTDCPAWHDLKADSRIIYVELAKRYNGSNNGRIPYSIREAVSELKISQTTAWRRLESLVDHGFCVPVIRGAFSLKKRHATEWRLTEFPCDVTHAISTKDFMRWQLGMTFNQRPEKQNMGTPVKLTGTPVKPNGYSSETVTHEKEPDGYSSETVEAPKSISRVLQWNTNSIPGEGERMSNEPESELAVIGHNQGPPLFEEPADDLRGMPRDLSPYLLMVPPLGRPAFEETIGVA